MPLRTLLVIYVLLALLYNWACPLFENADELYHFPLIHHLAENNLTLPVQDPAQPQQWAQQGGQPPLYHLLAALLISPIDRSDYAELYRPNPHARLGIVAESNINAIIHPLDRSREFRLSGTALAARLVRLFSTALGVVLLIATYQLVRYTFPDLPQWVALLACALIAFNPMFLFVTSSANNDNLSNAVIAVTLAWLARLYRRDHQPAPRDLLLIGVLLGVGLLSKLSMGPFLLLIGLYWLMLARKFQNFRYMVQWGIATLGVALLISGWWYWRNLDLYGDPTGLNRFLDIVGRRPLPLTPEQLWAERHSFVRSFWGVFGLFGVGMPDAVYTTFHLLTGITLLGAGLFYWQRRHQLDFPQLVPPLWAIMALISLIRWTSMTWASQGRLWFVAISALGAIGAIGWYALSTLRLERLFYRANAPRPEGEGLGVRAAFMPVLFTMTIALLAPVLWIRPAYAAPELTSMQADSPILATYQSGEQQIALVEARLPDQAMAGAAFPIQLTFCALTEIERDWSIFVHLVDEWEVITAQGDFTPGQGALPTRELAPGQCWRDEFPLLINPTSINQHTSLTVYTGIYDSRDNTRMRLPADQTTYAVGELQVQPGDNPLAFANMIRLHTYTLDQREVTPGETITLHITWEVLKPPDRNYTSFIQVLDPATAYRAAAADLGQPAASWQVGDLINVAYNLRIASDAPPGTYSLIAGFYHQPTAGVFARLRLTNAGADTEQDTLFLGRIRVIP